MKIPIDTFPSSAQTLPVNTPSATTFRSSSVTSPKEPSLICQARTPSQSPSLGACANVQGHGIVHLQTSNQSPTRRHCGVSAMSAPSLGPGGPADYVIAWLGTPTGASLRGKPRHVFCD